jgi:hypothetical protein
VCVGRSTLGIRESASHGAGGALRPSRPFRGDPLKASGALPLLVTPLRAVREGYGGPLFFRSDPNLPSIQFGGSSVASRNPLTPERNYPLCSDRLTGSGLVFVVVRAPHRVPIHSYESLLAVAIGPGGEGFQVCKNKVPLRVVPRKAIQI